MFFQLKSIAEIIDDLGLQIFTLKVLLNPSKAFLYPPESQKLRSDQTRAAEGFVKRGAGGMSLPISWWLAVNSILSGAGTRPQVCGL